MQNARYKFKNNYLVDNNHKNTILGIFHDLIGILIDGADERSNKYQPQITEIHIQNTFGSEWHRGLIRHAYGACQRFDINAVHHIEKIHSVIHRRLIFENTARYPLHRNA